MEDWLGEDLTLLSRLNLYLIVISLVAFAISFHFDRSLAVHEMTAGTNVFIFIFSIFTSMFFVIASAGAVCISYVRHWEIPMLKRLLSSLLITFLAAYVLKSIVGRPRPFIALAIPSSQAVLGSSFPSAHAAVMFCVLPFIMESFPRSAFFWLMISMLVAASRVFFGVHYLSDVIFGALLGIEVSLVVLWIGKRMSISVLMKPKSKHELR